jgi:hypothetical protein
MVRLAEDASSDTQIRERILSYLELGQVARELEHLVDSAEFRFDSWQALYDQIHSVDDAREWRGATARFLESSPDHPGLLIGRSLAEVVAPDGNLSTFSENLELGLSTATQTYLAEYDDALGFLEWLLLWVHERKNRWAGMAFLVAERFLGERQIDYLAGIEFEILADLRTAHPDELAVIASRRSDRLAATLESIASHAMEVTA